MFLLFELFCDCKGECCVLDDGIHIALNIGGNSGELYFFKKLQEKKKEKEAAKPDPDADYVGDDEDYGYSEEYEDEDVDFSADEEDNEPV